MFPSSRRVESQNRLEKLGVDVFAFVAFVDSIYKSHRTTHCGVR